MSVAAIVPFTTPGRGKSRLRRWLTPAQRAALATAMLRDVLDALASTRVDDIVVAARDGHAAAAARARGVHTIEDPPGRSTLDTVVASAAATVDAAHDRLVLMADLPRLVPDDVEQLLASTTEVVIAPTCDGGTAALLRRSHVVMPTAYGPGSADAHERLASQRGLSVSRLDTPGFRHDLDTIEDLRALDINDLGQHTREVVAHLTT